MYVHHRICTIYINTCIKSISVNFFIKRRNKTPPPKKKSKKPIASLSDVIIAMLHLHKRNRKGFYFYFSKDYRSPIHWRWGNV